MASKKLKQALMAGLAGYAGAKMLGAKRDAAKKLLSSQQTDTGDLGSEMANDTALAQGARKNMEAAAAAKTAAKKARDYGSEMFGLGAMDGAKTGKMIKANNGTMVNARGNKLARSKPTKLC